MLCHTNYILAFQITDSIYRMRSQHFVKRKEDLTYTITFNLLSLNFRYYSRVNIDPEKVGCVGDTLVYLICEITDNIKNMQAVVTLTNCLHMWLILNLIEWFTLEKKYVFLITQIPNTF